MTKFIALVLLSVALLASCSSEPQIEGTQFSANILAAQAGDSAIGKIYVKDHIYRMDLHQHGHDFIVIVNEDSNLTQLLMPPEKIYMDMPTDDQMSTRNDPFQALKYTSSIGENKLVATEKINGQQCDKYTITIDSNQILEYWQHKKLDFPIKIVGTVGPRNTMELSNIDITEMDDTLFRIPDGYDPYKQGMQRFPEPEWLTSLDSLPVMNAPFTYNMSAGKIIRVPFEDNNVLTVTADNLADDKSQYVALPLLNGKPVSDFTQNSRSVPSTTESFRFSKKERTMDEVVIWVQQGKIVVFVEVLDKS
ncbi:MAG: DUF4412 domain-containing protein [candidate division Zixibacteria bacterium]|nr:DUF4412 domain-containing protein [candidate division Zixibacteria bacterium]MBU1470927.1 DUF4412 domain-containing protein [candidate division Zixibacteria bacterium]